MKVLRCGKHHTYLLVSGKYLNILNTNRQFSLKFTRKTFSSLFVLFFVKYWLKIRIYSKSSLEANGRIDLLQVSANDPTEFHCCVEELQVQRYFALLFRDYISTTVCTVKLGGTKPRLGLRPHSHATIIYGTQSRLGRRWMLTYLLYSHIFIKKINK